MRYREILEAIKNNDDELFAPRFQFGNLSRPEALEKYYDLYDELYGYESYWHGDEPEFEEKERELEHLKIYVRQRFGEAFYNHMVGAEQTRDTRSDVFSKKDPFSNRQHREDPRVTKAGKLHKQDVLGLKNDVKNRIGTHRTPVLPESDDDELFGNMPSAASLTQSIARAIVRSDKSARLIASPFMVGFALGRTPGGEPLLHYWKSIGQEKQDAMLDGINDAVYDLIANKVTENDDDLFSKPGAVATGIKQSIKQIQDPYLRTVRRVRELAKTKFGIKTRVSSIPKSASRGTATFWFGDYIRDPNDPYAEPPKASPVAHKIKAELERQGFECKFTSSEWLSVRVPPPFSDILDENEDTDDLFASPQLRFDDVFNEHDEDELINRGFSFGEDPERDVDIINDYLEGYKNYRVVKLTGGGGMGTDDLVLHLDRSSRLGENDDSDDDMFAKRGIERVNMRSIEVDGIDHRDAPDYVDAHVSYATFNDGTELDHAQLDWLTDELANSGKLHELVYDKLYEDNTDDEMFGTSASAGQRMIYTYGKQLLHKLEQAYNNPQIKQEYRELTWNEETDEPLDRTDTDAQFQLVLRATGAKFGKAFVVDSIIRDFGGGMEGLNDFGWMIDDGIFDELTNGWEEFGRSTDVANQDWFRKELQTFMGDR
jgi:hypothetical protein